MEDTTAIEAPPEPAHTAHVIGEGSPGTHAVTIEKFDAPAADPSPSDAPPVTPTAPNEPSEPVAAEAPAPAVDAPSASVSATMAAFAEGETKKLAADARVRAIAALEEIKADLPIIAGDFFIGATHGLLGHCLAHLKLFNENV